MLDNEKILILKRTTVKGVVPRPQDLELGELAVNLSDKKVLHEGLFYW